jgi:autotransporter-associated beta strand protein
MNLHPSSRPAAWLIRLAGLVLSVTPLHSLSAGSASWSSVPASSDWNTAANWVPTTVPNGAADTASFDTSNQTDVSLSDYVEVATVHFETGSDAFTISDLADATLTISGAGILNDSGVEQNFVVGAPTSYSTIWFRGTATAGSMTHFTVNPGNQPGGMGGQIWFWENSTAGDASFVTKGSSVSNGGYGYVEFFEQSSAANGTFLNEGSTSAASPGGATYVYEAFAGNGTFTNQPGTVAGAVGGATQITTSSSAENATLINNGATVAGAHGGSTSFYENSAAANAVIIAYGGNNGGDGGAISFNSGSTGDLAQIKLYGNATLDVVSPVLSIGSLEGDGAVTIGNSTLAIGANNLSTTFSGSVVGNGELHKIGAGTLTIAGATQHSEGTTVESGTLIASHDDALGTGDVTVEAGAILELQGGATNDNIADDATLYLAEDSTLRLNFTGSLEQVVGLTIDGIEQAAGVYGAPGSGAPHELTQLSGTGTLLVMPPPAIQLLNISTRLHVGSGENVLIGGFILEGTDPKPVVLRGLGPSLESFGLSGALSDPTLELHDGSGNTIATNDDWRDGDAAGIEAAGLAPNNDKEAAILQTLDPGAYTVILAGANGATGIGLVEVYDLDQSIDSSLPNLSTRGEVLTGDDVMIGGAILGPDDAPGFVTLLIRAIGPSLQDFGINNALLDPVLTLYDANGAPITSNDDWKFPFQSEIEATGLAPTDDREAAILYYPAPGSFTAIVSGKDGATGVALVEIYNLH